MGVKASQIRTSIEAMFCGTVIGILIVAFATCWVIDRLGGIPWQLILMG